MEFLKPNVTELRKMLNGKNKDVIKEFIDYMYNHFDREDLDNLTPFMKSKSTIYHTTKKQYINLIVNISNNSYFRETFADALSQNEVSTKLYTQLIWQDYGISTKKFLKKIKKRLKLPEMEIGGYRYEDEKNLEGDLSFIIRYVNSYSKQDILYIKNDFKEILRFFHPIPYDYNLLPQELPMQSDFTYSNESKIFTFIKTFKGMLDNNLIKFNKSGEKPLSKTLKIVKQSISINEFHNDSDIDSLATDMLIRSFKYYSSDFKKRETTTLKTFVKLQFEDIYYYPILRILASHLKRIQLGGISGNQKELFALVKRIIENMPRDNWVGVENIVNYTHYRKEYFDFESQRKTRTYTMECDIVDAEEKCIGDRTIYVEEARATVFHEPILKATFFYLGALGLMELKYNKPSMSADLNIRAKGKPYISVWDSLKYVKLTELGKYVFGFSKSYTPKEQVVVPLSELKFDEFKPIITLSKENIIAIAKLEPFVEKLDDSRYILSYSKLFKDCDNSKALKLKIDGFYKNIEKNPPKVFIQFFEKAVKNSNLMKRNLKQIVIELKDNRELLNLFMTNRKLQELFIKAEGYRIIVLKEDIAKVTKIVKDNGFFVEFC